MSGVATKLEQQVVDLVARENWPGFQTDALQVVSRENTGAGRYTHITDRRAQALVDGAYSAQGKLIEMEGVRNGLGFVVVVSSSQLNHVEFFTYGNEAWDGVEREWRVT